MNLKIEEILILIVAFVIGYFVSNMISGSSLGSSSIVKAVSGKHHTYAFCAQNCEEGPCRYNKDTHCDVCLTRCKDMFEY